VQRFVGYGSLVEKESALRTCPNLQEFDYFWMSGFKRVFGLVAFRSVMNDPNVLNQKELSACYVVPDPAAPPMLVCSFKIPDADAQELRRREFEYYEEVVSLKPLNEGGETRTASVFVGHGSDGAMYAASGQDVVARNQPEYYDVYKGPYFRNDIVPCRRYLTACLDAYATISKTAVQNFIETSWLADERPLRDYMKEANYVQYL
jgi:hypothetical protein